MQIRLYKPSKFLPEGSEEIIEANQKILEGILRNIIINPEFTGSEKQNILNELNNWFYNAGIEACSDPHNTYYHKKEE
jgi:hypothetical protein